MSAPIENSCTYNPRPNMDVETVEESKLNPRPTSEGDFVTALGPAFQSTSAGSARQTVVSTQISRSAPEVSLGSQGQSLSKGQGLITKENDNSKEVHLSDKSIQGEKGAPADDFDNIQFKTPETKKSSADMSVEPSQLSKIEKGATGSGT